MELSVLKKVADGLNSIDCTWAVGSSVLLSFYSLVAEPHDIDILIDPNDAEKVKIFMDTIGTYTYLPSKEPYLTKEFFGYKVGNTDIEFLGGFSLDIGKDGIYEFILDDRAIVGSKEIGGSKINITSLEDWIVAYMVMKDPKKRVPLIKEFFKTKGLMYESLLERNLQRDLPENVRREIEKLLIK